MLTKSLFKSKIGNSFVMGRAQNITINVFTPRDCEFQILKLFVLVIACNFSKLVSKNMMSEGNFFISLKTNERYLSQIARK